MLYGQKINCIFETLFETVFAVVFSCICFFSGNCNGLTDQPNCEAVHYPIVALPAELVERSCQYLISSRAEEFPLSAAAQDVLAEQATCQSFQRFDHTIIFKVSF